MYGLFNTRAFTVVSVDHSKQILYCVIGFDIIQAFTSRSTAVISQHLDLTLLYADWTVVK